MKREIENYFREYNRHYEKGGRFWPRNFTDEQLKKVSPKNPDLTQYDVIQKAILDFEAQNYQAYSVSLREDAKLLLFVNVDYMIFRPLSRVTEKQDLNERIYHDVLIILKTSFENSVTEGKKEISSHEILKTGVDLWSKLSTLFSDSW